MANTPTKTPENEKETHQARPISERVGRRHSYEGDKAEEVRQAIHESQMAFNESVFARLNLIHVPSMQPEEERATFNTALRGAIENGQICITPMIQGHEYFIIDATKFKGDKELANKTLLAFLPTQKINATEQDGKIFCELSYRQKEKLESFLESLESKKKSLSDFGGLGDFGR